MHAPTHQHRLRSIVGGSAGNLVEWYDWYAYSAFTLYFAHAFFPAEDRTAQLLSAAAVFAVVVVVAGGIREEIQRAFLLRRFEQWLGGAGVGVLVTSAAFGAGHLVQGADAAIATGVLGAFWAIIYLRRRSVAAPIVSHAGFNLLQLAQFLLFGR